MQQAAREQLGKDLLPARSDADLATIEQRVAELLAKPLTADSAVQVALLNNRGLQASSAGARHRRGRTGAGGPPAQPRLQFRAPHSAATSVEIERSCSLRPARLIALPLTVPMEQRRFGAAQRERAMDVLSLAAETRKAYYGAVAAEETLRYMRAVKAGRRGQRRTGTAHGRRPATGTSCSRRASRPSTPTRR